MAYARESFRVTNDEARPSPEQRLWRAVLSCAVRDLQSGGRRADAVKRWMLTRGKDEDYRKVCNLADLNPDAFRRAVVRYIESKNGQLKEPCEIDDVLLSMQPFSVSFLGVPAHEAVERIKELQAEGVKFRRLNPGVYVCTSNGKPRPVVPKDNADADQIILSGNEFDAGPNRSHIRYRIQTLRKLGYAITSLGNRKFICTNPHDKSFRDAKSHPIIQVGD